MGKKKGGPGLVALTKRERAAVVGAELLALIESITEDGAITKAKIIELRAWLLKNRNEKPKAIRFLIETLERILADRIVTKHEMDELYDAMLRVFPPALRDGPGYARYIRTPGHNIYRSHMSLAEMYYRERRFDAALRTLDRGLQEAQTREKDKYDGEDWHWNFNKLREEIKIGALAYERYGEDMKGKCENCGKEPRKMYWFHTGIWVCTACKRVSISKKQQEEEAGAELLKLCEAITDDGVVSKKEIVELNNWLNKHRSDELPAIGYLNSIVKQIVADGVVTKAEMKELHLALEKVLPPEQRKHSTKQRNAIGEDRKKKVREEELRKERDKLRLMANTIVEIQSPNEFSYTYVEGLSPDSLDELGLPHHRVNEFYESFARLLKGWTPSDEWKEVVATLIYECFNADGRHYIRVDIDDCTIGYLGKQRAGRYRTRMEEAGYAGARAHCKAGIGSYPIPGMPGWHFPGMKGWYYGAWLDIPKAGKEPWKIVKKH